MSGTVLFLLTLIICSPLVAGSKSSYGSTKSKGYGYTNPSSTHVSGSVTKSGTYRQPHQRTTPNKTQMDNYSTSGNKNPYTGKKGGNLADK